MSAWCFECRAGDMARDGREGGHSGGWHRHWRDCHRQWPLPQEQESQHPRRQEWSLKKVPSFQVNSRTFPSSQNYATRLWMHQLRLWFSSFHQTNYKRNSVIPSKIMIMIPVQNTRNNKRMYVNLLIRINLGPILQYQQLILNFFLRVPTGTWFECEPHAMIRDHMKRFETMS